MTTRSLCTVTASTKRGPQDGTTKRRSAPVTHLTSVPITPLWPASEAIVKLLDLNSPRELKECYHVPAPGADLPDIVEGDILVVDGVEYDISYVGEWPSTRLKCLQIIAQEQKQNNA
ncbi:MAG: hypothetical protein U0350_36355 [Caldilineaceae bacterium]